MAPTPTLLQGLRTLVLGTRILGEDEYQEWNRKYDAAASSLDDREALIAAESAKIERDLELVGVTAIEDKLQEGVPQAINSLITANIKVRCCRRSRSCLWRRRSYKTSHEC